MGFKSNAQRKAVWASKNEKKNSPVKQKKKLTTKQKKLDLNNNGKIDAEDLKRLRTGGNETLMMRYGIKK